MKYDEFSTVPDNLKAENISSLFGKTDEFFEFAINPFFGDKERIGPMIPSFLAKKKKK